jgi:hypothetical protein
MRAEVLVSAAGRSSGVSGAEAKSGVPGDHGAPGVVAVVRRAIVRRANKCPWWRASLLLP